MQMKYQQGKCKKRETIHLCQDCVTADANVVRTVKSLTLNL